MERLGHAETSRGEVDLLQREDGAVELRVNGTFVMDTHEVSSETALAQQALAACADPRRVLVGGLGLGYTAHALLGDPRVEQVVVAEVEGPLIGWMRDGTVPHGPGFLADERIRLDHLDVRLAVAEAVDEAYDLVLLDTDNGPDQLVHESNAELYSPAFLADLRRVVSPRGLVAVWSAHEAPDLVEALRGAIGPTEVLRSEVDLQGHATAYWLHLARRAR